MHAHCADWKLHSPKCYKDYLKKCKNCKKWSKFSAFTAYLEHSVTISPHDVHEKFYYEGFTYGPNV